VKVVRIATCEEEETLLERMAAAEPASEGGEIRAAATTPERRAEMAKKAAAKRTAKTQDTHKFQTRLGSGKRKAPPSRAELWAKPDENAAQGACLSTMHQGDESSVKRGFGAQIGLWTWDGNWRGCQTTRCDTGIPSLVILLSTEHATRASVFWAGRVRARRPRPMMVL
jgi:hypothetical protein